MAVYTGIQCWRRQADSGWWSEHLTDDEGPPGTLKQAEREELVWLWPEMNRVQMECDIQ